MAIGWHTFVRESALYNYNWAVFKLYGSNDIAVNVYNISNPTNDEEGPWNVIEHIFLSDLEDKVVSSEKMNPMDLDEEAKEMNENEEGEYLPWFVC